MTTDIDGRLVVRSEDLVDTNIPSGLQVMKHTWSQRSTREFTGQKILCNLIEFILEAAGQAPSPENMLITRFILIRDEHWGKPYKRLIFRK